jgi:agmatinase/guanidinopropionase
MPRINPNPAYGEGNDAYSGITTFMRQPATRELDGVDVAIVGIPFDSGATSFRSGTRMGPRKIREHSMELWGYNRVMKVGPLDVLKIVDYGDFDVDLTHIEATTETVFKQALAILEAGVKLITLGGDHSISYPLLKAHAEKHGPLAVIHFDAHSDTEKGSLKHGTPFAFAAKKGLIDPGAFMQIGIRGSVYEPKAIEIAESLGAQVLMIEECFDIGIPGVIERIQETVGKRKAYVSLDIDVVDPAYAPGTGTPEVGGFTSYQMLQMVRGLIGLDLAGFDLVEVSPPYDSQGEITAILAANLAFEFLSLLALEKQK